MINTLSFRERPLKESSFYVMGQICIAKAYRRRGLSRLLYLEHKRVYAERFDFLITEVSSSNRPSLLAHEKMGFQTIHEYQDNTDTWHLMLWDWS